MDRGVDVLRGQLHQFGKGVAIDSTDISAYSRPNNPTDKDARWSKKTKRGRGFWWFGYKAHVVADVVSELPIHVEVTPANINDSRAFTPILERANVSPTWVMADAGYDSLENHRFVYDDMKAIPIIKLNRRGKRKATRVLHRTAEEVRVHNIREYAGVWRESEMWMQLYARRTSVERLFSRMKEHRRLRTLRHKGLSKATLHVYLSTLTVVASAVSALYSEQPLRKVA